MSKLVKFLSIGALGALVMTACTAEPRADSGETSGPVENSEPAAESSESPGTDDADENAVPETGDLTAAELADYVAEATWSFSDSGVLEPHSVTLSGGQGTDDLGRTYELGDFVEGDANADGTTDIAIPIAQSDGNGYQELWYIWLGGLGDGSAPALQVDYPIGLTARCSHVVNSVVSSALGFTVDEVLRTVFDQDLDCASTGSGDQIREIAVQEIDGTWYPIQVAPNTAWGGFCPPSFWMDSGEGETGWELLAAPSASAETVTRADEVLGLFPVVESSRYDAEGYVFVGYRDEQMGTVSDPGTDPIMNCAFALTP